MEPASVRNVPTTPRIPAQRRGDGAPGGGAAGRLPEVAVRATSDQSTPDEPMAVLVVGCHASGKREVIRALLRVSGDVVDVPSASYLVMQFGTRGEPVAHVPGRREPRPYHPAGDTGTGDEPADPSLSRPPRRVEATVPDPLLRHFALVDSPCARRLGVAGGQVLAEAAERGGAVVFVAAAGRSLTRSELDLLDELASRDVVVFFAVVPDGPAPVGAEPGLDGPVLDGPVPDGPAGPDNAVLDGPVLDGPVLDGPVPDGPALDEPALDEPGLDDPVLLALEAHRAIVAGHTRSLGDAPWFAVDPVAGDVAYLRRALVEWAGVEGLRRASDNPPVLPGVGTVHVGAEAADSGWSDALDRWREGSTRLVRQRLAIEVANVHLRCVQDLVFGAGRAGLPETLDHELHALSQRATAETDTGVATVVYDVLRRVLGGEPTEDVRRRVVAAVRRGLAEDAQGGDLARVLLVTSSGGVATVAGQDALLALAGYAPDTGPSILPPVGMAVSGGCYALWRREGEVSQARAWLQNVTRAVELELMREVGRRLEAVHRSLGALIGETVDHGILLA